MTIDFYYMPLSAPCRSVMMGAKALGVPLNLKVTDIMAGANRTPEYLKVIYIVNINANIDQGVRKIDRKIRLISYEFFLR